MEKGDRSTQRWRGPILFLVSWSQVCREQASGRLRTMIRDVREVGRPRRARQGVTGCGIRELGCCQPGEPFPVVPSQSALDDREGPDAGSRPHLCSLHRKSAWENLDLWVVFSE